ncbi:ArsR family transcriptional regulator [Haloferax namakaokahaiae]|uniref:ArsR family transcriptional regulator n=1 Tax=Haloferax namakaokahaiae TaxID=1748331 RepID=A0ABD5ZCP6_9EURY
MKLAVPTDFDILEALSNGRRNTAVNLSYILDKNRSYINTRLPILADYGLLTRVGPAPNSGLYEITDKGRVAAAHRDQYRSEGVDFDELVESEVRERFDVE